MLRELMSRYGDEYSKEDIQRLIGIRRSHFYDCLGKRKGLSPDVLFRVETLLKQRSNNGLPKRRSKQVDLDSTPVEIRNPRLSLKIERREKTFLVEVQVPDRNKRRVKIAHRT